ncbi:MAG: hypothetical protein MJA83_20235, partial [Gammaproteobacteria bacterium]|nr:hypothetical protein [Gammaproteobacteria bacterium]
SKYMHGGGSPLTYERELDTDHTLYITRRTLLGVIPFFWKLNQGGATDKELENSYISALSEFNKS